MEATVNVPPAAVAPKPSQGFKQALTGIILVLGTLLAVKSGLDTLDVYRPGAYATAVASLVAFAYVLREKLSLAKMGWTLPQGVRGWAGAIGVGLIAVLGVILYTSFFVAPLLGSMGVGSAETVEHLENNLSWLEGAPFKLALALVAVWLTAAIGEEWLMRGFLQSALESLFGGTRLAIVAAVVVQTSIFGMLHDSQGLYGMLTTGLVGLYLTVVFLICGRRLVPVIVAHGVVDTIGLVSMYLGVGLG